MENVEMEELNKKIAEWLGWKFHPHHHVFNQGDAYTVLDHWTPSRYSKIWVDEPNFTTSLDACFEYIVPKLQAADISIEITCYRGGSDKSFGVITRDWSVCDIVHTEPTYNYVSGDSLPLALCRAVEKLIDERR